MCYKKYCKNDEDLIHATTWMKLAGIILRKRTRHERLQDLFTYFVPSLLSTPHLQPIQERTVERKRRENVRKR